MQQGQSGVLRFIMEGKETVTHVLALKASVTKLNTLSLLKFRWPNFHGSGTEQHNPPVEKMMHYMFKLEVRAGYACLSHGGQGR